MNGADLPRIYGLDAAIVALYFIVLWGVALRSSHKSEHGEQFLLAGRRLTMPAFVATLVTTWYGGILGVGEFGWKFGISTWLVFGVPYYLHAVVFALFLAPKARRGGYVNLPDQLEKAYGRGAAITGAALLLITTIPAAYILMLGILIRMVLPMPLFPALLLGATLSTAYLWSGGFRAVVRTDALQFVLMFGGFIMLLGFCFAAFSPARLTELLPPESLSPSGGNTTAFIVLWYIVAAQTYIEPTFHQRCYAASSASVARKGTLLSVCCWLFFDIMTITAALYSRALLPDLPNAVAAFPALAIYLLPVGLLGLFFAGLFATVMSTVDSYGFLSAILLGRDIIGRMKGKISGGESDRTVRFSLILTGVAAVLLAAWKESVIDLWRELGSIGTPALLIPVVSSFWNQLKMSPAGAKFSLVASGLAALIWSISGYLPGRETYWFEIEPIYMGMSVSIVIYIVDRLWKTAASSSVL